MQEYDFYPLVWTQAKNYLKVKGKLNSKEINLNIPLGTTKINKSYDILNSEDKAGLFSYYDASKLGTSIIDPRIIIMRNPIIEDEDESNWSDSKEDPMGKVTSFFQALDISPYTPFIVYLRDSQIDEFIPSVNERYIRRSSRKDNLSGEMKRLYWDIEVVTPRKEFVYAKYIDNHIISISLVYTHKDIIRKYFLYWGAYEITNKDFTSIRYSREKEVIEKFYDLIIEIKPDRMYTFNGDSFDIPYLVERSKLNSIDPRTILFEDRRIKGRFKWEDVVTLKIAGTDQIDILRVMLKFYPGLPNYKLETIGKLFLGEGKTGLQIEEMFKSFYIQSSTGMEDLARYSVKDSVLLSQLNTKVGIDILLEDICNKCGMLLSELLDTYNLDIIDKFTYMVDPGSVYSSGKSEDSPYLSNIEQNRIYKNVHIYDYSTYYTIELNQSNDDFTFSASEKSEGFPGSLKETLYWSKYVIRSDSFNTLRDLINSVDNKIEVTPTLIKTLGPIDAERTEGAALKLVDRYTHFLPLGKVSFVAKNWIGEIVKIGTVKILKPKFKLGVDYLNECIKYIFEEVNYVSKDQILDISPEIPRLETVDIKDLLLEVKIKDKSEYAVNSEKYVLANQYGKSISTWVNIKYYMTTIGPVIEELINGHMINREYYIKELNNIKKILKHRK